MIEVDFKTSFLFHATMIACTSGIYIHIILYMIIFYLTMNSVWRGLVSLDLSTLQCSPVINHYFQNKFYFPRC